MAFELELIDLDKAESIDTPNGRIYTSGNDKFWSVTTVLGRMGDKAYLDEWRRNVGHETADKITATAGVRGSAVHDMLEKYVRGDPDYAKGSMPFNKMMVKPIAEELDRHLTKVHLIESTLISKKMQIAGRCDVVGLWKGDLAIIDFKTSRAAKNESDILDYFIQETLYAMMLLEMTGIRAKKIVTLMSCDSAPFNVFVKEPGDYVEMAYKLVKEHHKTYPLPD